MNEAGTRKLPIFADRFRELRGERTQAEFADFLGISRPTVGFYENGDRVPDAIILKQIAERCGVTSDYLLGLSDNRTAGNADIGAEIGLSDEAIRVLKAAHMEKKTFKKDNERLKFYWLDVFNILIEALNYFPDLLSDIEKILTVDENSNLDLEEKISEIDENLYHTIYKNGVVLTGWQYADYLQKRIGSYFESLLNYIVELNNPNNTSTKPFTKLVEDHPTVRELTYLRINCLQNQLEGDEEEGAKNANNPKEE